MNELRTIEIALPQDYELTDADLQVLRGACEDLVRQSCRPAGGLTNQERAMADEGWRVHSALTWIARAERGRESEESVGETKGQALCRLCQLTGLHMVDGCP